MNKIKVFLLIAVLFLGLILKLHNYSVYPQRGATSDEYSYSFQGVSLLTKGVPISWSAFTSYKNIRHLTIDKLYFPIVYPYFDHTPLNGIATGAFAIAFGENTFEKIQLKTIRIVPIILSSISSILIFLIGLRLFNYKTALWALLIYSTTTIFAIQGRVVLSENLLTPFLLLSIYLFINFYKKINIKKTIILGILSGLMFWTKEIGAFLFAALFFLFLSEKIKIKYIFVLTLTFVFFVFLYVLYGTYYNAEVFWSIISSQSGRNIGPDTLLYIISNPIIVNKIYYDGWYFFGFFVFFVSFIYYKQNKFILVPATFYLFFLLSALTQKGEMGWYIIPLFPLFSLFSAKFLIDQTQKISFGILPFLFFAGNYTFKYFYEANFGLTPIQYRIFLGIIFLPVLLTVIYKKEHYYRFLSNFWFYVFILVNIFLTYNYIHPA